MFEKIKILLITSDKDYAHRLSYLISHNHWQMSMDIFIVEDIEDITLQFDRDINLEKYKIILLDITAKINRIEELSTHINKKRYTENNDNSKDYFTNLWIKKRGVTIYLVDGKDGISENTLYKFKPLSRFLAEMMKIYTHITGEVSYSLQSNSSTSKIYSITSAKGGVGSSSIAIGLANILSLNYNEKVLYLSLGQFHQEREFFYYSRKNNFRELLYDIFYGKSSNSYGIEMYLNKNEYDVFSFNTPSFLNRLKELDTRQFEEFIQIVVSSGIFSTIILDIGNYMDSKTLISYNLSDYMIYVMTEENKEVEESYMRFITTEENNNVKNHIRVFNKFEEEKSLIDKFYNIEEDIDRNSISTDIIIVRDDKSFILDEGIKRIDLSDKFGIGIKQIIDILKGIDDRE